MPAAEVPRAGVQGVGARGGGRAWSTDMGSGSAGGTGPDHPAVRPLRSSDPWTIGGYRLTGRVGSGGMGLAYLATDDSGTNVVVKTLRDEWVDDPSFMERFAREARALSRIQDPRVVRVIASDLDHDPPYIVTEYVPGPTLRQRVDNGGPLPEDQVEALARELAHAVASMHQCGLAHRDLTPANIILSPHGPRVIDFGLAKDTAGGTAHGSTLMGTPGWVSPEALRGEPTGAAADVFLWGEVVVYASTGRAPFGEDGFEASARRTLHEGPDLSGVPTSVSGMANLALQSDPTARPPAWHLAAWLGPPPMPTSPLGADSPKPASPPPTPLATPARPEPGDDATHALGPAAQDPASQGQTARGPAPQEMQHTSLWRRSPALRTTAYGAALGLLSALVFGITAPLLLTFESEQGTGVASRILGGLQEVLPFALVMAVLAALAMGPARSWWRAPLRVLPVAAVVSVATALLWGWLGVRTFDQYAPHLSGLMVPAAFTGALAVALVIRAMTVGLVSLGAMLLVAPVAGWLVTGAGLPYEVYQVLYGAAVGAALGAVGWIRRQQSPSGTFARWGDSS